MERLKKFAETVEAIAWAVTSILVLKFVWEFISWKGSAQ